MKRIGLFLFSLILCGAPLRAADTLADWAAGIESPEVQRKILSLVFPSEVGAVPSVKSSSGMRLFSKGGFWVRLGGDFVWSDPKTTGYTPFMAVSVLSYHDVEKPPIASTSYILYNTQNRPAAISAGYSAHERVQLVTLENLKRMFLVLIASSAGASDEKGQWTIAVFPIGSTGLSDRPKAVWASPLSARNFQIGFDGLGAKQEKLLMRNDRYNKGEWEYSAYSWDGNRFSQDSFASERQLRELPEQVWQFGTGR